MHERLKRLEDDLNAVCLWKDEGVSCRPLGLCSIFTRSAERCIALQERVRLGGAVLHHAAA